MRIKLTVRVAFGLSDRRRNRRVGFLSALLLLLSGLGALLLLLLCHSLLLLLAHCLSRLTDSLVELANDLVLRLQVWVAGLLLAEHLLNIIHFVRRILNALSHVRRRAEFPGRVLRNILSSPLRLL